MNQLLDIFALLFITMGPIKPSIVFAKLTSNLEHAVRRKIVFKTVSIAFAIGILFIVAGKFLTELFHFSIPALQIAGGSILFVFAVRLVLSSEEEDEGVNSKQTDPQELAVYPLAMPLMASPMGIVVLTTFSAVLGEDIGILIRLGILVILVMVINLIVLLSLSKILRYIPLQFFSVTERILGILLASLAVETILKGLAALEIITIPVH